MTYEEMIRDHRMRDTYAGYDWGDPIRLWTARAPILLTERHLEIALAERSAA